MQHWKYIRSRVEGEDIVVISSNKEYTRQISRYRFQPIQIETAADVLEGERQSSEERITFNRYATDYL